MFELVLNRTEFGESRDGLSVMRRSFEPTQRRAQIAPVGSLIIQRNERTDEEHESRRAFERMMEANAVTRVIVGRGATMGFGRLIQVGAEGGRIQRFDRPIVPVGHGIQMRQDYRHREGQNEQKYRKRPHI